MATILVFHNEVAFKFFHHSWVYKIFPEIILRIFLLQFSLLCTTKKFFTNALQIRISWTFHTYLVFRYWESFSNVSFIPFFVFGFLALLAKITKIQKYYVIFAYMLQGKIGKTEKNLKENHATKVTKIPKTKTRKYGMNET